MSAFGGTAEVAGAFHDCETALAAIRPVLGDKRKCREHARNVEDDPSRKWTVHRNSRGKSDRSQVPVTYWAAQEAVRPR
jgi:hypothetical protein